MEHFAVAAYRYDNEYSYEYEEFPYTREGSDDAEARYNYLVEYNTRTSVPSFPRFTYYRICLTQCVISDDGLDVTTIEEWEIDPEEELQILSITIQS